MNPSPGTTLTAMTADRRQPQVVVLGGGSGAPPSHQSVRAGADLQWVRSVETAEDINKNHRNSGIPRRRSQAARKPESNKRFQQRPPTAPM